jgi:hypothetical protein
MTQDKKIKEFNIYEAYPYELKYVIDFMFLFLLGSLSFFCFVFFNNIFIEFFMAFSSFVFYLMSIVLGEKVFSKDEKFIKGEDKINFKKYCKIFPTSYKRLMLGDIDFERTSIRDIEKLNKKIKKINKTL